MAAETRGWGPAAGELSKIGLKGGSFVSSSTSCEQDAQSSDLNSRTRTTEPKEDN